MIQYIKLPLLQLTLILDGYSLGVKVLIIRPEVLILGQYLHFAVVHALSCATGPVVCVLGFGGVADLGCDQIVLEVFIASITKYDSFVMEMFGFIGSREEIPVFLHYIPRSTRAWLVSGDEE